MKNGNRGFVDALVSGIRAGLPWICALAAAGAIAFATSFAIVAAPVGDEQTVCDTSAGRMLYVGSNQWVPAEAPPVGCARGTP